MQQKKACGYKQGGRGVLFRPIALLKNVLEGRGKGSSKKERSSHDVEPRTKKKRKSSTLVQQGPGRFLRSSLPMRVPAWKKKESGRRREEPLKKIGDLPVDSSKKKSGG